MKLILKEEIKPDIIFEPEYEKAKKELFDLMIKNFDIFDKNADDLIMELTILSIMHNKNNLSKYFFKSMSLLILGGG